MNRLKVVAICLIAGSALPATAQVVPAELPESPPAWAVPIAERNAALAYHRAWSIAGRVIDMISDRSVELESWAIPEGSRIESMLVDHQEGITDLIEATTIADVDWQTPYDQGVGAALPHLQQMRKSARVLAADAARLARDGDIDGASTRLAAIYDLARHASTDHVVISSLVGIAIGEFASERVDELLDRGQLTADARGRLLAAIDRLDADDPFRARRSFLAEGEMVAAALIDAIENSRPRLTAACAGPAGIVGGDPEVLAELEASIGGPEALRADLPMYLALHRDIAAAWSAPDAADRLAAIDVLASEGAYGTLARLIAPAAAAANAADTRTKASLERIEQRLRDATVRSDADQPGRAGRNEAR